MVRACHALCRDCSISRSRVVFFSLSFFSFLYACVTEKDQRPGGRRGEREKKRESHVKQHLVAKRESHVKQHLVAKRESHVKQHLVTKADQQAQCKHTRAQMRPPLAAMQTSNMASGNSKKIIKY